MTWGPVGIQPVVQETHLFFASVLSLLLQWATSKYEIHAVTCIRGIGADSVDVVQICMMNPAHYFLCFLDICEDLF